MARGWVFLDDTDIQRAWGVDAFALLELDVAGGRRPGDLGQGAAGFESGQRLWQSGEDPA